MTQIIAIAGKKQSGKSTLSNFIHGHEMKLHDVVQDFSINEFGNLVVNYVQFDENGKEEEGTAVFDLWQQSEDFINYAQKFIWPLVKGYNFADSLKEICINLFGLSYEQVYGLDSNKNSLTDIMWEDMPGVMTHKDIYGFIDGWGAGTQGDINKIIKRGEFMGRTVRENGPMTAREFMQYFGTEIMRKINKDVWVDNCLNRIKYDNSPIAIISDCRFVSEAEAIKKAGGVVIGLKRDVYTSNHSSEVDMDNYEGFDAVIDNRDMTVDRLCGSFLDIVVDMGFTKKIRSFNKRLGTTSAR